MTDKHLLFYASEGCKFSQSFIKKLKDENLLNEFKLIDVLELHRNGKKIPSEITNTPTIIVKNMSTPLTGKEAFDWIDTIKYFYQKTTSNWMKKKSSRKMIIANYFLKNLSMNDSLISILIFYDNKKLIKKLTEFLDLKHQKKLVNFDFYKFH